MNIAQWCILNQTGRKPNLSQTKQTVKTEEKGKKNQENQPIINWN